MPALLADFQQIPVSGRSRRHWARESETEPDPYLLLGPRFLTLYARGAQFGRAREDPANRQLQRLA